MTEDQTFDQEVELHDEDVVEEAHDPKNAEAQAVAAADAAGDATGEAPARKGDNTAQEPMPKTKAGMLNAMMMHASKMKKADLMAMYNGMMKKEDADWDGEAVFETADIPVDIDFEDDLNALVSEEATLSDDFKGKAATIFEAAVKSKLGAEIDRLEEKYDEELAEEVAATKSDLVEKVDSYLNYVVESWMEDNKIAVQAGLRTEIAEKFMTSLKDLFVESYIDVPESKVDLVDDLAEEVAELETKLNETTGQAIAMSEELESFKRNAVIREASKDLAETQIEKLKSLTDDIDFVSEETFAAKVATVKESYFTKPAEVQTEVTVEDEAMEVAETSDIMAQYLSAIKKTSK